MGIGGSSSGRRQRQNVNTNPSSSVSPDRCPVTCCTCPDRSDDLDLEFYVHGIDFLPEYEKRRRRLAKLVRGGHLWSWNASYTCFESGSSLEYPKDIAASSITVSRRLSFPGKQHFGAFRILTSVPSAIFFCPRSLYLVISEILLLQLI